MQDKTSRSPKMLLAKVLLPSFCGYTAVPLVLPQYCRGRENGLVKTRSIFRLKGGNMVELKVKLEILLSNPFFYRAGNTWPLMIPVKTMGRIAGD